MDVVVEVGVGVDVNEFGTTSVLEPPGERVGGPLGAEDTEDTGAEGACEADDAVLDGAPEEDSVCEVTVAWERDEKRLELSRESEEAMLELSLAMDDETDEGRENDVAGADKVVRGSVIPALAKARHDSSTALKNSMVQ